MKGICLLGSGITQNSQIMQIIVLQPSEFYKLRGWSTVPWRVEARWKKASETKTLKQRLRFKKVVGRHPVEKIYINKDSQDIRRLGGGNLERLSVVRRHPRQEKHREGLACSESKNSSSSLISLKHADSPEDRWGF